MKTYDYIVVGSGCSGAMAAQTLIEAGAEVAMLDVGMQRDESKSPIPDKDYLTIRQTEHDQHHYFIGENADGVVWSDIGKGAQVTPPRSHMIRGVDKYIPLQSKTFSPIESLGYGGLGISWGLQCWEYSEPDLRTAGLDPAAMIEAYETVSKRIGVSGTADPDSQYTLGELKSFQPSPSMDRNHQRIYQNYVKRKSSFNKSGFYLSRTPLALITENKGDRKAYAYRDMDYYSDNDKSAWRPWITVDALRATADNFHYIGNQLVVRYVEKDSYTEVHCLDVQTKQPTVYYCRTLILGGNALGSGRIALRSSQDPDATLPLLCNPYSYIPCLQPAMIGKGVEQNKLGFAQLSLFLDDKQENQDISVASLYSYQSLMLFRIIKQVPLNFVDARKIMNYLLPGIVIMGVHHPDNPSNQKYIRLIKDGTSPTGDHLEAQYKLTDEELKLYRNREQRFIQAGRKLGIHPLAHINPGYGSSVHYAGTLPFSDTEKPLTLDHNGRLHGTKRVFVADSSGFNRLPARGLTFTLLANAHNVAKGALS